MYKVTKKIEGFSTAFRQWKANTHCNFIHGYAIWFTLEVESENLDEKNWVIDFGSFKKLKEELKQLFDHTTVVSKDDPYLETFKNLAAERIIDLRIIENVGCESFAKLVFEIASKNIQGLVSVTCHENKTNSATFKIK